MTIRDIQSDPGLTSVAAEYGLILQPDIQPGTARVSPRFQYLCLKRTSPCYGTTIYLPMDEATPQRLREEYSETRQKFVEAHPFEALPEMREA